MSHTNESCYHLIFDASPLPAWISDASSGRLLIVNDAALHQYGYSREEFLALSVDALRPSDGRMRPAPRPPERAAPLGALATDREHRSKDGSRFAVRLQVIALEIDDAPAHLTISLDAAPRDAALAQRELRLIEAQQLAHVGSWEANAVTGETSWSRETYRLYGAAGDVVPSLGEFLSRVHAEDRARVSQTLADASKKRLARFDFEFRILSPDGSVRWLSNRHVATYDESGQLLQIRGTVQDITAQRVAERALAESELRHRLHQQNSGDDVTEIVPSETILYLDPAVEQPLGHALGTLPSAGAAVPLRILLAGPNLADQEVSGSVLRRRGHHVTLVNDGQAAVAAVTAGSFDLVMMDVHMPVMDGLAATKAIRALPGVATLPIVAVAADASPAERARCLVSGLGDYLTRPFTGRELIDVIEGAVSRRRVSAPLARISEPFGHAPVRLNSGPPVDVAAVRALMREGDVEDAVDGAPDTFLSDAPRRKASVLAALESGDGAVIRDAAHADRGPVTVATPRD